MKSIGEPVGLTVEEDDDGRKRVTHFHVFRVSLDRGVINGGASLDAIVRHDVIKV